MSIDACGFHVAHKELCGMVDVDVLVENAETAFVEAAIAMAIHTPAFMAPPRGPKRV